MSPLPGFPSAMTGSRHWIARRGSRDGVSPAADTPFDTWRRSVLASGCSFARGPPRVEAIGRSWGLEPPATNAFPLRLQSKLSPGS
eukprot:scaffold57142_cov36-Phaeocystis_antarctica.AAC.1